MDFTQSTEGTTTKFDLKGKFTFSDHENFREIISAIKNKKSQTIMINFAGVEFIDSAALGMMLIARDEAGKSGASLILKSPEGQVDKMFSVSKFDSLFTIEK